MNDYYNKLLEAWRRERNHTEIQSLPNNFFIEMEEYKRNLHEIDQQIDKSSTRGKIADKEKKFAEKMITELNQLRVKKIVKAELDESAIPSVSLTPAEQRLNISLKQLLTAHRQDRDEKTIVKPEKPKKKLPYRTSPEKEAPIYKVVYFLKPIPAIMGIDMKIYGPFKNEDIASLPVENALNLIRRGIAKEVEIGK